LTSIESYAFEGCTSLTAINIPEGVTSIGDYAFSRCGNLIAILIPKDLTSIEKWSFYERGITYLTLPKSVTSIGEHAFWDCISLAAILIPKGVTSIGKWAFSESGITYLTILGKPTIDEKAFNGCEELTDIYCYSEEVPPAKDNTFGILDLSRITLHVPESAIEQYKNTTPWNKFGKIVAIK
jgi:hypothetical protein